MYYLVILQYQRGNWKKHLVNLEKVWSSSSFKHLLSRHKYFTESHVGSFEHCNPANSSGWSLLKCCGPLLFHVHALQNMFRKFRGCNACVEEGLLAHDHSPASHLYLLPVVSTKRLKLRLCCGGELCFSHLTLKANWDSSLQTVLWICRAMYPTLSEMTLFF